MKKYFVKLLPSPSNDGEIKPMMCSHDIKQGDTYYHLDPDGDKKGYIATEVIPVGMGITNLYPWGKHKLGHTNTDMYKIEGEISYLAHSWIKEGDKFSKKNVKRNILQTYIKTKNLKVGDPVIFDFQGNPKKNSWGVIKSIEYSDKEFVEISNWDDKIHITDIKCQDYGEVDTVLMNTIIRYKEDIIRERCDIEFNGETYYSFDVQCSKCKTFH